MLVIREPFQRFGCLRNIERAVNSTSHVRVIIRELPTRKTVKTVQEFKDSTQPQAEAWGE